MSAHRSHVMVARTYEDVERLRSWWLELQRRAHGTGYEIDVDRFLDILDMRGQVVCPYVVVLLRDGEPTTMLVGNIGRDPLSVRFGLKTIRLPALTTLGLVYGGLLGDLSEGAARCLSAHLEHALMSGEFDAVFFYHVPKESEGFRFARSLSRSIGVDLFPRCEPHWRMSVPDSTADFYASLNGKRRYNLRRTVRLFKDVLGSRSAVTAYGAEADVPNLAAQAEAIVSKTYQRGMGSGFRDSPEMRFLLTRAAGRGWLRGHVLTVDGEPCAFQIGLHYRDIYFLEYISYLPRFKEHSPGTVLFLKVVETLCADPGVHALDFGYGDQQYKQAYGEECWEEASFYVFAPRVRPVVLNGVRTCAVAVERALKGLARRFALDGWVKRRWRERLEAGDAR